jgi:hypothetical protein
MKTFNQNRFHILVQNYLKTGRIMQPDEVNRLEPVLSEIKRHFNLHFGTSMDKVMHFHNKNRFFDERFYLYTKNGKFRGHLT